MTAKTLFLFVGVFLCVVWARDPFTSLQESLDSSSFAEVGDGGLIDKWVPRSHLHTLDETKDLLLEQIPSRMESALKGDSVKKRVGFWDGHNHITGIVRPICQAMCAKDIKSREEAVLQKGAFEAIGVEEGGKEYQALHAALLSESTGAIKSDIPDWGKLFLYGCEWVTYNTIRGRYPQDIYTKEKTVMKGKKKTIELEVDDDVKGKVERLIAVLEKTKKIAVDWIYGAMARKSLKNRQMADPGYPSATKDGDFPRASFGARVGDTLYDCMEKCAADDQCGDDERANLVENFMSSSNYNDYDSGYMAQEHFKDSVHGTDEYGMAMHTTLIAGSIVTGHVSNPYNKAAIPNAGDYNAVYNGAWGTSPTAGGRGPIKDNPAYIQSVCIKKNGQSYGAPFISQDGKKRRVQILNLPHGFGYTWGEGPLADKKFFEANTKVFDPNNGILTGGNGVDPERGQTVVRRNMFLKRNYKWSDLVAANDKISNQKNFAFDDNDIYSIEPASHKRFAPHEVGFLKVAMAYLSTPPSDDFMVGGIDFAGTESYMCNTLDLYEGVHHESEEKIKEEKNIRDSWTSTKFDSLDLDQLSKFQGGLANVRMYMKGMYDACKGRKTSGDKPCLFRTHLGEGFPVYDYPKYLEELKNNEYNTAQREVVGKSYVKHENWRNVQGDYKTVLCKQARKPWDNNEGRTPIAHRYIIEGDAKVPRASNYGYAEWNTFCFAKNVNTVRKMHGFPADFDDVIKFRFGHCTHINEHGAKEMKEAKIACDVNLFSNLATRNLDYTPKSKGKSNQTPDTGMFRPEKVKECKQLLDQGLKRESKEFKACADKVRQKFDSRLAATTRARLDELKTKYSPEQQASLYPDHGLINAMIYGIPVLLGSDGTGSEFSKTIDEARIVCYIIQQLNKEPKKGFPTMYNRYVNAIFQDVNSEFPKTCEQFFKRSNKLALSYLGGTDNPWSKELRGNKPATTTTKPVGGTGTSGSSTTTTPTRPSRYEAPALPSGCCKICKGAKACGDKCIKKTEQCKAKPGCACDTNDERVLQANRGGRKKRKFFF